jgi:hypothetical protein
MLGFNVTYLFLIIQQSHICCQHSNSVKFHVGTTSCKTKRNKASQSIGQASHIKKRAYFVPKHIKLLVCDNLNS